MYVFSDNSLGLSTNDVCHHQCLLCVSGIYCLTATTYIIGLAEAESFLMGIHVGRYHSIYVYIHMYVAVINLEIWTNDSKLCKQFTYLSGAYVVITCAYVHVDKGIYFSPPKSTE